MIRKLKRTPSPPLPAPAGSEAPQYEFTRCGGVIMLMVPRFTDHGMICAGETFHGISDKTARQLRDQLNALLALNSIIIPNSEDSL
jgi:hypothetical protein